MEVGIAIDDMFNSVLFHEIPGPSPRGQYGSLYFFSQNVDNSSNQSII
jgi:hypothetical protein